MANKVSLFTQYQKLKSVAPYEIDYHPKSHLYPENLKEFLEILKGDKSKSWIFKPSKGSRGLGIFMFTGENWEQTEMREKVEGLEKLKRDGEGVTKGEEEKEEIEEALICEYIQNPLLFGGYKHHMRIYV